MLRHDGLRTCVVEMVEFAKNKTVNHYKFAKFTGKIGDIKTAHMTFCIVRRKGKK